MRKFLKRVVEILDGTPATYGKPEGGQSVLEMTLITPLLIILIVGIVEIGWYAHNYLTLLEVSRVGARRGAVLTGDNSPLKWDEDASTHYRHPHIDPRFPDFDAGEAFGDAGLWTQYEWDGDGSTNEGINRRRFDVRQCPPAPNTYVGFYNLVLCQMEASMTPLEIKWTDEPDDQTDDIIISVFSVQMVNNDTIANGGDLDLSGDHYNDNVRTIDIDEYEPGWIPVVVGRFPATTNECNMWRRVDGAGTTLFRNDAFERDPFDYYQNEDSPDIIDVREPVNNQIVGSYPLEMAYEFRNAQTGERSWISMGYDETPEMQRGFNYTGYRRVEQIEKFADAGGDEFDAELFCYGSDWSVYDVQELLKSRQFRLSQSELQQMRDEVDPNFGLDSEGRPIDTGQFLPSQGLILVEIYWRHQLLMDIPVFSPVFQALGSSRTTIYVWSAFPVPAATPDLSYNLTWEDYQ